MHRCHDSDESNYVDEYKDDDDDDVFILTLFWIDDDNEDDDDDDDIEDDVIATRTTTTTAMTMMLISSDFVGRPTFGQHSPGNSRKGCATIETLNRNGYPI